jgi:GDP-L-fucose synthase
MKPSVVIHLVAEAGSIGANRENHGRFFYANVAMGLHLIEHARIRRMKKFVESTNPNEIANRRKLK